MVQFYVSYASGDFLYGGFDEERLVLQAYVSISWGA